LQAIRKKVYTVGIGTNGMAMFVCDCSKWAVLFQMMKVEIDEQLMKTSLERPMENILEQQATAIGRDLCFDQ
jgi:hypothetical protein